MAPVMILGSFGVAGAQTVLQLMFWRIIQGMGAFQSGRGSLVISMDSRTEVRLWGHISELVFLVLHLPRLLEGLWCITGHGEPSITSLLLSHLALFSLFPETSHPGTRGVDQFQESGRVLLKWRPVILNPLPQLLDLRSPTVLAVLVIDFLALMTGFTCVMWSLS